MTTVAEFSIQYHQYLDAQQNLVKPLPAFAEEPDQLVSLYKTMVMTRMFDTKAIALQRTGKMGTYASTLGQEAIFTAIGHCLRKDDVYAPYYRDYAVMLQRGISMTEIYRYWGGDERGNAYANNAEDMPLCVPIASQCLHAAGIAKAIQLRKQDRVVCVSIGEGGTSEGDFYEAMNVAGAWNLPVVFIVNNNRWAISVAREYQTCAQTIAQKAIAAGIPGEQVDGNDLIAMVDTLQNAIDRARRGEGPAMIEALTYRLCDHTTADDATRYVPQDALNTAKTEEPIQRLRTYLDTIKAWDNEHENAWQAQCQLQVQASVDEYLNTPKAPVTDMFDYHYATLPDALIEQRAEAEEEVHHG